MPAERIDQQLTMPNGSGLGYAECGQPTGAPVICCHGSPGSRLDLANMGPAIVQAHVRLIAPDRSGIRLTDFGAGYQLLDWPERLLELADSLGLERFAVLGLSGGGPFSAACAYNIPKRLTRAAIVSGIGFLMRQGLCRQWARPTGVSSAGLAVSSGSLDSSSGSWSVGWSRTPTGCCLP